MSGRNNVHVGSNRLLLLAAVIAVALAPVAQAGLVAYWDFEEGTGSTATDKTGNGHDGTLQSMEEGDWVAGRAEGTTALNFDGSNNYIETGKVASDLNIDGGKPKTVAGWVYTRAFNNGGVFVVGTALTAEMFCLRTFTSVDSWRAQLHGATVDFDFKAYGTQNTWVHCALVHDGAGATAYFNGLPVGGRASTIKTTDTRTFRIGLWHSGGTAKYYFNGMIDDLAVWDEALSPGLIGMLATGTAPDELPAEAPAAPDPVLTAYWDCEDGAGTTQSQ